MAGFSKWMKWLPWRYFVTRAARAYGFLDPIPWLTRLRSFAHPSEVSEPVELLRAGVLFHARGLINTKAIQHNLDWVWPYWVERQFNPADHSFIPRAFSFSHINLTHRNWTAVGLPDLALYPIVDPRGLVTPMFDGWSLDFWLIGDDGRELFPSKLDDAEQRVVIGGNLRVVSSFNDRDWRLDTDVAVEMRGRHPHCVVRVHAATPAGVHLAVAIRPQNPEGVSFINSIEFDASRKRWRINDSDEILFSETPDRCCLSNYRTGDVSHRLGEESKASDITCKVSMASGAALFAVGESGERSLEVQVPLADELTRQTVELSTNPPSWPEEIKTCSRLAVPDERIQELYDVAVASLILHSPGEVYPGPYTYKRFWYRDAALILNALISLGAEKRTRRALDRFPNGQTLMGYFKSQEGEWDSNGEVLWILHRYLELTGETLPEDWVTPVEKGARWIINKRLPKDLDEPHAGLFPAGFSAEHLGPNDFYYWDDFWGVAGLRAAAAMLKDVHPERAGEFAAEADDFLETIERSFRFIPERKHKGAISASPHRRMDAGSVGSVVAGFPLQLFPPGDERLMKTVEYLLAHSSYEGGFFQNMIHSGINAYLTLHLAQVLLRAGDPRSQELIETVARLSSPTGQWPEAIHPQTGGGCMGDGQHIWAAAEWAMMIRNLFVREEGGQLVIGSGLFTRWLEKRESLSFGPTLTPFGPVTVRVAPDSETAFRVMVEAKWRKQPPQIEVRLPGHGRVEVMAPGVFRVERDI